MLGIGVRTGESGSSSSVAGASSSSTRASRPSAAASKSAEPLDDDELVGVARGIEPALLPEHPESLLLAMENAADAITFLSTRRPGWNSAEGAHSGAEEDAIGAGVAAATTSPRWIPLSAWIGAAVLSRSVDPFTGHGTSSGASLLDDMLASPGRFKNWLESDEPEHSTLPLDWRELDDRPVHKSCAVVALRPDRGKAALTHLAAVTLPRALNPNANPRVGQSTTI